MASADEISKLAEKIRRLLIEHSAMNMLWLDKDETGDDFEVDGWINLRWLAERILTDEGNDAAHTG